MNHEMKAYQRNLERFIQDQIPHWDDIAEGDPQKVILKGIVQSVMGLESVFSERIKHLFEMMPSFLRFEPKPAVLPWGLFKLSFKNLESDCALIESGQSFIVHCAMDVSEKNENTSSQKIKLISLDSQRIFAGEVCSQTHEKNKTQVSFTIPKFMGEFAFVLECKTLEEASHFARHLKSDLEFVSGASKASTLGWQWDQPQELAKGFKTNQTGRFVFCTLTKENLGQESALVGLPMRLSLHFKGTLPLKFITQVAKFSIANEAKDMALGSLTGQIWESLPFPPSLVDVPEKLTLLYPDGQEKVIKREREPQLQWTRLRQHQNTFVFDGTHFGILIPDAPALMGEFLGGVQVILKEGVYAPSYEWPFLKDARIPFEQADFSEIEGLSLIDPERTRESSREFSARFFTSVRKSLHQVPHPRDLKGIESYIEQSLALSPSIKIRALEQDQCLKVYFRGSLGYPAQETLQSSIVATLNAILPAYQKLEVLPFEEETWNFYLNIKLKSSLEEVTPTFKSAMEEYINNTLQSILNDYIYQETPFSKIEGQMRSFFSPSFLASLFDSFGEFAAPQHLPSIQKAEFSWSSSITGERPRDLSPNRWIHAQLHVQWEG